MKVPANLIRILAVVVTMMSSHSIAQCSNLLDYSVRRLASNEVDHLCEVYRDKVVMIVNTASMCGFTPQFEGLEALYAKYKNQGFAVIGFPSPDFGGQEYASEKESADFCRLTYGVKFPMYATTHARKGLAAPLFKGLAEAAGGKYPKWNFHKYIVGRDGQLIDYFSSFTAPNSKRIQNTIENAL